ncbi:MAG: ABC transporter ATP-binding protein [Candidatus Heimdallarchaeota archaeon]|nr:ABC transporter ATP-binding protein [Candidatus Heimdallarchaeota archaeon]
MSDPIVVVRELNKTYDNGTEALKSITFEVNEGEIFGLIGVNGAGKTTLIRSLVTMLRPTSGSARVMGIDPVEEPERVRALVGVLPQNAGLYEEFTIRENLTFIAQMQNVEPEAIDDRINEVVEILGITDRLDTRVDHLSGGLKQRTMIARTLLGQPKLLFLDEPTTGLDVLVARKVRKTIKELSSKMTIFLATHNMFEAYQLCTKVAIIKEGVILMIDSPQNILKDHRKNDEDFEDVIARILGIDDVEVNEMEMEV